MKILFCIATEQNAVNINPLTEINPDKVLVLITNRMKDSSQVLLDEIKSSGFKAEPIYVTNENSLKSLNEQFSKLIEDNIDYELIANITGGLKTISISLYLLFSNWGFRTFYCDFGTSQLIWLDDETAISNIGSKIGLAQYLRTYQYYITKKDTLAEIPKSFKDYANILYQELCKAGKYEDTCRLIAKIHALTQQNPLTGIDFSEGENLFLYHLEKETKLFKFKNNAVIPNDKDVQKLMSGGWLEIVVASALSRDDYRDIHLGVYFEKSTQRKNKYTRQELDVMAMYQDKLLIVECKAKKWDSATQASEAIYKLSALSDIGGLNTIPVFVSLRDVPNDAKTRAAEQGIKVITGQADMIGLRAKLKP